MSITHQEVEEEALPEGEEELQEYTPRGGRASSGFPRGRGYSSRPPPRDELYPRRPERDHSYDRNVESRYGAGAPNYRDVGPGMKRSYAAVVGPKIKPWSFHINVWSYTANHVNSIQMLIDNSSNIFAVVHANID